MCNAPVHVRQQRVLVNARQKRRMRADHPADVSDEGFVAEVELWRDSESLATRSVARPGPRDNGGWRARLPLLLRPYA